MRYAQRWYTRACVWRKRRGPGGSDCALIQSPDLPVAGGNELAGRWHTMSMMILRGPVSTRRCTLLAPPELHFSTVTTAGLPSQVRRR
jgi:hypothetical protein